MRREYRDGQYKDISQKHGETYLHFKNGLDLVGIPTRNDASVAAGSGLVMTEKIIEVYFTSSYISTKPLDLNL